MRKDKFRTILRIKRRDKKEEGLEKKRLMQNLDNKEILLLLEMY